MLIWRRAVLRESKSNGRWPFSVRFHGHTDAIRSGADREGKDGGLSRFLEYKEDGAGAPRGLGVRRPSYAHRWRTQIWRPSRLAHDVSVECPRWCGSHGEEPGGTDCYTSGPRRQNQIKAGAERLPSCLLVQESRGA